ncbi:MFS transporter [Paenarthrobacter sp. Z7-10]|uniref:MFS transporter n=1 Tax=Paenarthrobacter sp. Z7-10 TaxID=2787635 RepID=UPI0022A985E5|nr:MFS transporter [Paenarthrobacter sp. Z7-10]MCZ2402455.1 MFS transporter [Paenarthrobacter sp. Z7-10]
MTLPASPASEPAATGGWHRGLALLAAATFFMENLDGTVLVTAVPSIAADFQVASTDVNVTMTAYLVTVAMFIPVSGWLTERFGDRKVFCTAIALFTAASALCALSPDLTLLTLSRILQGIGGAMMVPVGRLVVLRYTDKKDLLRAIAFLTWPALLAPVIAPLIGGIFTSYLSWHWIFLINVPLGMAAFWAAVRMVPVRTGGAPVRLDWFGLIGASVGIGALVVGLELISGSTDSAGSAGGVSAVVVLGFAAVSIAAAVWWMLRTPRPLFDLRTLRIRTFRVSNSGGFIYRTAISAAPFLLPLLFQNGYGWDPLRSGAMVAAVFVGNIAIKPATTPLIRGLGFRPVLLLAIVGSAITFVLCALLPVGLPDPLIFALLVISGAFRSIGFTAYNSLQFADVGPKQMGSANALSATVSQLGSGLGIAIGALSLRLGAELSVRAGGELSDGVGAGTAGNREGPAWAMMLAPDPLLPYRIAFLAMAALILLCVIDTVRLPRDVASHVSGVRPESE